jgi:hypothetical protein
MIASFSRLAASYRTGQQKRKSRPTAASFVLPLLLIF